MKVGFIWWRKDRRYFSSRLINPQCWEFEHTIWISLWYFSIYAVWPCNCEDIIKEPINQPDNEESEVRK